MRRWVLVGFIVVAAASFGGYALARTAATATVAAPASSQQLGYVDAVIAAVAKRDSGCNALVEGGSSQSTPTTLRSILAVVRRPIDAQDRQPQSLAGLAQAFGTVYVNYVRRARAAYGQTYFVVPLIKGARVGAPARCIAEQKQQLRARLPKIPKPLRSSTLKLAAQTFTSERRVVHPNEALGLIQIARALHGKGRSSAGVCCAIASAIAAHGGPGATDGPIFSSVVPDGVATVTLSNASSHRKALTITTRPVGNIVVVSVPRSIRNARHQKEIWRSANGTVIKTITR